MKAKLLLHERRVISEQAFVELAVWQVPAPVPGSEHSLKYRLAFVVNEVCVLRYDNETGKGDHKHVGGKEMKYAFTTPERLFTDFFDDVNDWRP